MYTVVLVVNLLICLTLIGLVLLQRSEGGALGMGGGGNALMSGRGAADALARMTGIAGGLFLICSFALTFLAQSERSSASRSLMLAPPAQTQTAPAPTTPHTENTTPLLSPANAQAAQAPPAQTVSVEPGPTAPAPTEAQRRAGPIAPTTTDRLASAVQPAPVQPRVTAPAPPRTGSGGNASVSASQGASAAAPPRQRVTAPALTQTQPESVEAPPSETAPARRRAGPDQ